MVFIHVIRERPSGLVQFPAGEAVKICFACVSSGIHAKCPNRDRRLDWTMAERWGCLVNLLTSSLRTCWSLAVIDCYNPASRQTHSLGIASGSEAYTFIRDKVYAKRAFITVGG